MEFKNSKTGEVYEANNWNDMLFQLFQHRNGSHEEFRNCLNTFRNSPQFMELYKTENESGVVSRAFLNNTIMVLTIQCQINDGKDVDKGSFFDEDMAAANRMEEIILDLRKLRAEHAALIEKKSTH